MITVRQNVTSSSYYMVNMYIYLHYFQQFSNDKQILEIKLSNKAKDFEKLHDKYKTLQVIGTNHGN